MNIYHYCEMRGIPYTEHIKDIPAYYSEQHLRFLLPIVDIYNNVITHLAWNPYSEPKYIMLNTSYNNFLNLYDINKFIHQDQVQSLFITEGLPDTILLKSLGLYSIAVGGSYLTSQHKWIIEPIKDKLILIADNDESGMKLKQQLKVPTYIPAKEKDLLDYFNTLDNKGKEELIRELKEITDIRSRYKVTKHIRRRM